MTEIDEMDNCTLFGLRTNHAKLKKHIENLILDILKGYLKTNMPSQEKYPENSTNVLHSESSDSREQVTITYLIRPCI